MSEIEEVLKAMLIKGRASVNDVRGIQNLVDEAILAERKRCADIARNAGGLIRLGGPHQWHGAEHIAEQIEAGT